MHRLEKIALACATECVRQKVSLEGVCRLIGAYDHALRLSEFALDQEDIYRMGSYIEPDKNANGYRKIPVTFANGTRGIEASNIPQAMKGLVESLDSVGEDSIDYWIKSFLDIHPFIDGNGRCAFILHNWLSKTLDDPHALPDYYNG